MRLHRLRIQAFGPFAGSQEVDLDALAAPGLFLLHGPTGAGKTSVLDAVTFALYGRVPGARAAAAVQLRSDHAEPDLRPEVVCDLTVAGRRLEVTRSPAWDRPKKRGSGTTTEPARTLLRERRGGEWVAVSARNDEASQLLTDLVGMGLEQFTKVVLLPQGEFASFLRAGAEERRPLLQRLFGTDRFATVERWLAEERRRLAALVEDADARVDRLVAQAQTAAAGVVPEPPPEDTDPPALVEALAAAARAALVARTVEHADATRAVASRSGDRDVARARLDVARRLVGARAEADRLVARETEVAALAERVDAARRAASVEGHLAALAAAERDAAVAATAAAAAAARLEAGAPVLAAATTEEESLRAATRAAREEVGRLETLLATEAELTDLRRAADEAETRAVALEHRVESSRVVADQRAAQVADLRVRLDAVTGLAATADSLREEVRSREEVAAAALRCVALGVEVEAAAARAAAAVDDAQAFRETWLGLREQRLAGMAAELAGRLVDGEACAVCGATDHPRPADAGARGVTREQEDVAHGAVRRADERRAELEAATGRLRERLAAERARAAGRDPDEAARDLQDARHRAAAADRARRELTILQDRLAELERAARAADEEREALVREAADHRSTSAAARQRADALAAAVAQARGDDASVADRVRRLTREAEDSESLVDARAAARDAAGRADRARDAAESACRDAGLGDVRSALAALSPAEDVHSWEAQLAEHRELVAAATARRRDAEEAAAARGLGPDVDDDGLLRRLEREAAAVEEALVAATTRADEAARALALAERATATLDDLVVHVAADTAATVPLRRRSGLVASLSRCAEGTGSDNALRMRLSSFVLAARLEQVAAAATVRLHDMSGGRYALVHSDAAERRGARSGLGLRVVDAWTGVERETASLSGGESFLASLALALGLADVVQAESGGAAIETLFVDEGFGTLDEETLEDVMTTLDGLREGGRAVGVVSHVPELRQRIPSRLEVVKTPSGSHLRTATGAA